VIFFYEICEFEIGKGRFDFLGFFGISILYCIPFGTIGYMAWFCWTITLLVFLIDMIVILFKKI